MLSLIKAVLHLLIIIGGPDRYRFFGDGEGMAQLEENDSVYPSLKTLTIALVFFMPASCGFSDAGIISKFLLKKYNHYNFRSLYNRVLGIPLIHYFN